MRQWRISPIRIINFFFPLFLGAVILVVGIPVATYHYFAHDLSTEELIVNRRDTGLTLLDAAGEPFFRFYDARSKEEVDIEDVPQYLQDAVVASEDKRFYDHEGFSVIGIIRAFYANLRADQIEQGGSTITQQLAKNAFLTPKKSYLRKYQEIILAQEIEKRYTKKQILEMYLNSVYFGQGAFGIDKAAEVYFDKEVTNLTLAESALLTGILPAPSALSPLSGDPSPAFDRMQDVLRRMKEQGYITQKEYNRAMSEEINFREEQRDLNAIAPHFAIYVRNKLIEEYGENYIANSGMTVQTTLNRELQRYAEEQVRKQVLALNDQNVTNAAAVVIDAKTHAIEAMVGSVSWADNEFGKVNVAVRPRQPGSSFKPYVYAKALEERKITLATVLHDEPSTFGPDYTPQNYDRRYRGNVSVRRALANSLNVPAVEVMTTVGVDGTLEMARRFGISSLKEPVNYGPSLVLGTGELTLLEHTNGYATFADNGLYAPAYAIENVQDRYGNRVFEHSPQKQRVLSEGIVYLITSVLSDAQARRETFGSALDTDAQAAVKTGTTDDYKDSWTMGYTSEKAVGVWVGNNDNEPMEQIAGSLGAAPIWKALIEYTSLNAKDSVDFQMPESVSMIRICENGARVPPNAPVGFGRNEFFVDGTTPDAFCSYKPPEEEPHPTPADANQTSAHAVPR